MNDGHAGRRFSRGEALFAAVAKAARSEGTNRRNPCGCHTVREIVRRSKIPVVSTVPRCTPILS